MTIRCYHLCCRSQQMAQISYSTLLEVHFPPLLCSTHSPSTWSVSFSSLFPLWPFIPHRTPDLHPYTSQRIHSRTIVFHYNPNSRQHSQNDENISYFFVFDSQWFQWRAFFPWFWRFCMRTYQHEMGWFPSSWEFDSIHNLCRCRWWLLDWFQSHWRRGRWVEWWRMMWRVWSKLIFFPSLWVGSSSVYFFLGASGTNYVVFLFPCIVFIFLILIGN